VSRRLARSHWLVAVAAVLALAFFLGYSAVSGGPGFPLDDGWIHQTYARNLAERGQWAFVPGLPSAGSTAPLWTLLLVPAYLLSLPPLVWTFVLGGLLLIWLGWASMALWQALWPEAGRPWLAGLAVVLSWPLVWAAGSGMETLLFAALGLEPVRPLRAGRARAGSVAGAGRRVARPGPAGRCSLAGPAGSGPGQPARVAGARALPDPGARAAAALFCAQRGTQRAVVAQYTVRQTGRVYSAVRAASLAARSCGCFFSALVGPRRAGGASAGRAFCCCPDSIWAASGQRGADWRQRRLVYLLPLLWAAGHIGAYAWRLPVTYQHGRYLLGVVPVWIVFGLYGWIALLGSSRQMRLLRRVGGLSYGMILLLFLFFGAQAYATDVAFIEGEMVATAGWLRENTPPDALVAAHDIGAIGYFSERPLLDLAGLVSPEIIPFLDDEAAVADYVQRSSANYLVTAPGWPYQRLTSAPDVVLAFETGYEWTRAQGVNNMAVYRLPPDGP
jgi:hypothetical protein